MGEVINDETTSFRDFTDLFGDGKKELSDDFLDARGGYASWTTHIPLGDVGDPEVHVIQEFDLKGEVREFVVRQAFGVGYVTYGHISYWPPRARDEKGRFKSGPRVELFG